MDGTYFQLLPNELLLTLSLYFNYRDTVLACSVLKCDNVQLWLNKIRQELGYSNEFISEYVYDVQNNIKKTILPINEKYLELKARKSVDFGTEFYNKQIAIEVCSRLADFQLADELTHYFLKIGKIIHSEISWSYMAAMQGAFAAGNFKLFEKLDKNMPSGFRMRFEIHRDAIIVAAVYERYPNGNKELLNKFKVDTRPNYTSPIITGLAIGGHLEQLKKYDVDPRNLGNFLIYRHQNIIDYYDLLYKNIAGISYAVMIGNIDAFANRKITSYIVERLIENGYLEHIQKHKSLISKDTINLSIRSCFFNNHIDVVDYLFKNFPNELKEVITAIDSDALFNLTDIGLDYLYKNGLVTKEKLKGLVFSPATAYKMLAYNAEALDYINRL